MAKKFFYNKVYNTKRTIINVVIIGACIIGIILCFVLTSNFQGENRSLTSGALYIKEYAESEINQEVSKEIFFRKIENVDLESVKIEYPEDFDNTKIGKYDVVAVIDGKEYKVELDIVDTTRPSVEVKDLTIHENSTYGPKDFISSCEDNSGEECKIEFYTGDGSINEEGEKVDYSKYKKIGTYVVKLLISDSSKNEVIKEVKLAIVKKGTKITEESNIYDNKECKYGTNEYDTEENLVAIDITSNGCAVNIDLYKDDTMTEEINKLMEAETTKIMKDMENVDVSGTPALNRTMSAIVNKTNNGIVGYELRMTVSITKNNKTEILVDYKVNSEGKRVFIKNPYNIPS